MKKNRTIDRFLAFLLCATLLITYMPSTVYTLADEGSGAPEASADSGDSGSEAPKDAPKKAETSAAPAEKAEVAPAPKEPVVVETADDQKEEAKEPETPETRAGPSNDSAAATESAEEPAEEAKESVKEAEEPAEEAEESVKEAEKAAEEAEESVKEAEKPAEEVEEPAEEAEEPAKEAEEPAYPAVKLEGKAGNVDVEVKAPEGALPEGVKLDVEKVSAEKAEKIVEDYIAEDKEIDEVLSVDIRFTKDGKKVEPKKAVTVKLSSDRIKGDNLAVYNKDKNGNVRKLDGSMTANSGKFERRDFARLVMVTVKDKEDTDTEEAGEESEDAEEADPDAEAPAEEQAEETAEIAEETAEEAVEEQTGEVAEEATEEELVEEPEEGLVEEELIEEPVTEDEPAYPKQEFSGSVSGVAVSVTAPEGALPEGTTMKVRGVSAFQMSSVVRAVEAEMGENAEVVKAVDITFYDADGNEVQPNKPVSVSFNSSKFAGKDDLSVVHIDDNKNADKVSDGLVKASGSNVKFDARDFSIYVVVTTGDDARLLVRFVKPDGTEDGEEIASMYVKKGDNMEQVLYDPGIGSIDTGVYFRGWTTTEAYTTETEAKSIEDVRTDVNAMLPPAKDGDTVTYYAMLFKDYRITYYDENKVSLGQDEVAFRADATDTSQPYEVNMAYTVQSEEYHFEGWTVRDGYGRHIVDYEEGKIYQNDDDINITGDVIFDVNAPAGNWFIFHENGKGAQYNAPQFVYSGEKPRRPEDETMTRFGYDFGGWFDSKEKADDVNNTHHYDQYDFDEPIEAKTEVWARWIPKTQAPYTVIFWTQNVNKNGYEVKDSYVSSTGRVGQNIPYTSVDNGDEDYVTGFGNNYGHYTGFCLTEASKNQQITITPEGDAVLNLYYDRIQYNFKFYLYRNGTQNNRYDYANNSGGGSDLNGLVTWHSNQTQHPSVSGYTIQSETVGGRTYYYFVMSAYYGENISSKWPTYDKITGANNRDPVSYVMMVGTKLKPNPTSGGSGTVKGTITILDESILGATNNKNGNYVIVRFPGSYYNWRYHIWYETVEGEDYSGKTTRNYNGKTYYEETVMEVRSSNTEVGSQNKPDYPGFEFVKKAGDNASHTSFQGDNFWTTTEAGTTQYHLNFIYNREQYKINYFDGNYVDESGSSLQNRSTHLLRESEEIGQGATIADEYRNYVPDLPEGEKGYVFDGWYVDEGCTAKYTWTTMPIDGIKVYAKWRQKQYRVFLHANYPEGATGDIEWGAEPTFAFRVSEGGFVSPLDGRLDGYEFVGWFLDEACTKVFNGDAYIINEDNVKTPYDKSKDMTDTYDNNGNLVDPKVNKDLDRFWITTKLDVYAKWRATLDGASGIYVVYDANKGSGEPTDETIYVDGALAPAGAPSTPPAGSNKVFGYWVAQKWNATDEIWEDTNVHVYPGGKFEVLAGNAKVEDIDPPPADEDADTKKYTVQLRAEYINSEEPTPTFISWFRNDGTKAFRQDKNLDINQSVDVPAAPTRTGYEFLGWARLECGHIDYEHVTREEALRLAAEWEATEANWTQDLDEDDIWIANDGSYSGKKVAADEDTPYQSMFAVWKPELKIRITGNTKTEPYNGSEQSVDGYKVEYQLADGEWSTTAPTGVTVSLKSGVTAIAKGTNAYTYQMGLANNSFNVDSGKYKFNKNKDLDVTDGWLTITPKAVTVTAQDKAFTYNGEAQSWPEYDVVGLEGDDEITAVVTGSITFPSESPVPNVLASYEFTKGTPGNYSVTTANGKLTMTKASVAITITAASDEWTYDGSAHQNTAVTVTSGTLFEGDELVATATGSVTNVADTAEGNNPIAAGYKIMHGEKDVTANYVITTEAGTLTINPKAVTVTAQDKAFTYNGTAQSWAEYDVVGLVGDDAITAVVTGSITFPSESPVTNVLESYEFTKGTPGNYSVTKVNGELTMTNASVAITITAASDEWTYDGNAHQNTAVTVTSGTLFEGDELVATATGSVTNAADTAEGNNPIATGYKIMHGKEDVTASYSITTEAGTLTINPKAVTVTAQDKVFAYNGEAQSWPEYDVDGLEGDDAITAVVTGSITFPSESPVTNKLESYEFTKGTPGNYTVTTKDGKLTMTNASVAITITAASDEWTYDGNAHQNTEVTVTSGELLAGDELVAEATGSVTNVADTAAGNNPVKTGYKIMHGEKNVTANYAITAAAGKLTINPKPVTITAKSKEFTYDGTAHSNNGYDVAGLVGNDAISAVVTGTITFPSESPVTNVLASYEFTKGTPGNYSVTTANGKLTMKNASVAITITAASDEWTYDGNAHQNTKVIVTSGKLFEGDTLVAEATGSVTNAAQTADGNNPVKAGYKIMHGKEDVTASYSITTEAGTLTINPKAVTVTAQDKAFTYNGTAQSWPKYDADGLVGEDAISAVVTGSITFPSESPVANVLESYEFTEGTPGNYSVTTANGKLTMTKASAAITITAASDEWTYDGKAHKNTAVTATSGDLFEGDELVATATGSVTNVADTTEGNNPIAAGYKIMHGTKDVTENYVITTEAGMLTIKPKAATVTAKSEEFTYDGTAHSNNGYDVAGLVRGDMITAVVTGSITFPSESPVTNKVESYEFTKGTAGNYSVTTVDGELTMKKASAAITITAASDEWTYDGKAHRNTEVTVTSGDLFEGDELVAEATGSVTNVADTAEGNNPVKAGYKIMHGKEDVTASYSITAEAGTLTIEPKAVTVTAQDKAFAYDGTAHSWPEYDVEGLVGSDAITAVITGSITFPSESPVTNKLESYKFTKGIARNYSVTTKDGELTMTNAGTAITITAASQAWPYDGKSHQNTEVTVTSGKLLPGDTLVATATGSVTNVAQTATGNNPVKAGYKIMHGEEDVTDNYAITAVAGTLTINPKQITVSADDKTVPYNGSRQEGDRTVRFSGVVEGQIASIGYDPSKGTDVGTYDNGEYDESSLIIKDGTISVTDNYELTSKTPGKLTITQNTSEITVVPGSGSKTYDGTPFTKTAHSDFTVTGLPDGFTWTATADGTVTNVKPGEGEKAENAVTSFRIFDADGKDVTDQFGNIDTSSKSTLTIEPREVTLTSESGSKTYDGTPLTKTNITAGGDGFIAGQGAAYKVTGSQTLVGESKNTFTYTAKNGTDLNNYKITKIEGTLKVTDGEGPGEPEVDDDLVVTKSTKDYEVKLGETATFEISATNIYEDARTITLEEIDGVTLAKSSFEDVAGGETVTTTATYTITEADVAAGSFTNTVAAKVGNITKTADATVTAEKKNAHLTVSKTTTSEEPEGGYALGDKITYRITVTNSGNVMLRDIEVKDTLVTFADGSGMIDELAPGEGRRFTYSYTVTEADVAAGRVVNRATASGTDPGDKPTTGDDEVTVPTGDDDNPGGGGNPGGGNNPTGGGNPAGGGTPAVNPGGGNPDGAVVPDNPVPEVEPDVDIVNPDVPLAPGTWALINLISAILTTLGAAVALFRRKEEDEEEEDQEGEKKQKPEGEEEEEEDDNRGKKMLAAKIAGAVAGVAAPITFLLTEDMTNPMTLIDKWTLLMLIMLAAQIIAAVFNKKASELDDEEEETETEAEPAN